MKNILYVIVCIIAVAAGFYASQSLRPQANNSAQLADSNQAIAFTLPDVNGQDQSSEQWAGKTVVLNFWATWCPPCRHEIPLLVDAQNTYAEQGLQVVGIAIDDVEAVNEFTSQVPINYPNLVAHTKAIEVGMAYGNDIGALPFTVVISPEGEILERISGELDQETIDGWFNMLTN